MKANKPNNHTHGSAYPPQTEDGARPSGVTLSMIDEYRDYLIWCRRETECLPLKSPRQLGSFLSTCLRKTPVIFHISSILHYPTRVAYLAAVDGGVEWRYTSSGQSFQNSPLVTNRCQLMRYEEIFGLYYQLHKEADVFRHEHASAFRSVDRIAWATHLINSGERAHWFELAFRLFTFPFKPYLDGIRVIECCQDTLGDDWYRMDCTLFRTSTGEIHYRLEGDNRSLFVDANLPGDPRVNALLCFNQFMKPHYETRRIVNVDGPDTYFVTLAGHEWLILESRFGDEVVTNYFEVIKPDINLPFSRNS